MDVRSLIARARAEYEPALDALLADIAADCSPPGSLLTEMSAYQFATGGKRLRALIPLLAVHALGKDPRRALPLGAACEMLHNATLVHDDLQDGDTVRRCRETVWKRWSPAQAINLGDAMFQYALALLQRLDAAAQVRLDLTDLFLRGTVRVIDGQAREFLLKDDPEPTPEKYFAVVEGKTSGLFEIPLVGAALLADAPEPLRRTLEIAARDLGVLFQIQDDVLDLYGEKGREGRGSDLAEGKISALVVHALHHGAPPDAERLRAILRLPREQTTPREVDEADALFRSSGALRFALDEIRRRAHAAGNLPALADAPPLQTLVRGLADAFVQPIAAVLDS